MLLAANCGRRLAEAEGQVVGRVESEPTTH